MELKVVRMKFFDVDTQGFLYVNGQLQCATLEPLDRGLSCDMDLQQIAHAKVPALTAIPVNNASVPSYRVVMQYWGAPHNRYVPTLASVPGYSGVGIHSVGSHKDTEGCLGVGTGSAGEDLIAGGFAARDALYTKLGVLPLGTPGTPGQIQPWPNGEEYYITYEREPDAWAGKQAA